ncbi:hypothetical protein [Brevundimonas sp.]|uniref:hypothetical protein n=1 Tax=Brevundimonas sp. TaxID=1871086 RepID=UPI00356476F3
MADPIGKRHDAKGRSTGGIVHYAGRAKRWKFEEAFVGEPMSLLESPGYQALNFPAFKILGFLKLEHVRHGGAENGRLLAPHRQLRQGGISPRKVKPALDMLEAFGIIRCTSDGFRQGGRPNAATYALTWLPTCDGLLPRDDYKRVSEADVQAFLTERYAKGFAERRKTAQAPTSERDPRTQVNVVGPNKGQTAYTSERGAALTSEPTIYILGGGPAVVGEAGRGAEPSNSAASNPASRTTPTPASHLKKIGLNQAEKPAANDGLISKQPSLKQERA